eukprot:8377128-Ditylum_brightwellii.AAC.1
MEVWRANIDIQLILDARKVTEYMTKYVTKPESDMPLSFINMIRYIMQISWPMATMFNLQ